MKVSGLIDCCGILVLSGFGNTSTAIDRNEYSKEEVSKFLDDKIKSNEWQRFGIFLATLNQEQYDLFKDLFLERGFISSERNYHPNHDSYIYILTKQMYPDGRK